eukprot:s2679_g3.t1
MGSSVEATPAVEVAAPTVTGAMLPETNVNQAELDAVEAAKHEGESPMTPKEKKEESDEDTGERAAKRSRLGEEEEKEEMEVDAKAIKLCLEGCQRALDYVARQQLAISELQKHMIEIGSVTNHAESCQRYSMVSIQQQGENVKNATWQLTGNKHEAKTAIKSLVQQLVTCANNGNTAVKKLAESITNQTTQFGEAFSRVQERMLQLQGQVADAFAAAQRGAPAPSNIPTFPPVAPMTPSAPEGHLGGYGSLPASVAAPSVAAPSVAAPAMMVGGHVPPTTAPPVPPPMTPRPRATVQLSLRMTDGTVQTRVALGDICLRFVWQAWHSVTSAFTLCGRRGTYATGLALVAALVAAGGPVAPRLFCVAGGALGDICLHFLWQAWRLRHWAGSGGGFGRRWGPCGAAPLLRGRRGTWRHLPSFSVAGVALGDICLHFLWQAWHLRHWAGSGGGFGRRWGPCGASFAWQAWHLATSAFVLCGRRGAR